MQAAQQAGFNVLYGDGSRTKVRRQGHAVLRRKEQLTQWVRHGTEEDHRPSTGCPVLTAQRPPPPLSQVLHAAGIEHPRAVVVGYTARQRAVTAVEALRESYPGVPIYARALDLQHAAELQAAGATAVASAECEAGLALGGQLAQGLGAPPGAVRALLGALRDDMQERQCLLASEVESGRGGGEEGRGEGGGSNGRRSSGGGGGGLASVFKVGQGVEGRCRQRMLQGTVCGQPAG